MLARLAEASLSLDIGTLFVVAICVTSLLGLFLLFAWMQDRISALAWWGSPATRRTIFYGSGRAGGVETTALAALALLADGREPAEAAFQLGIGLVLRRRHFAFHPASSASLR